MNNTPRMWIQDRDKLFPFHILFVSWYYRTVCICVCVCVLSAGYFDFILVRCELLASVVMSEICEKLSMLSCSLPHQNTFAWDHIPMNLNVENYVCVVYCHWHALACILHTFSSSSSSFSLCFVQSISIYRSIYIFWAMMNVLLCFSLLPHSMLYYTEIEVGVCVCFYFISVYFLE